MTNDQIKNILSDEFIISSANIDNRKGNGLGYLIIKDLLKMIEGRPKESLVQFDNPIEVSFIF